MDWRSKHFQEVMQGAGVGRVRQETSTQDEHIHLGDQFPRLEALSSSYFRGFLTLPHQTTNYLKSLTFSSPALSGP